MPSVPSGTLEQLLPTFGARTTLWINGHELARDIATSTVGPAIRPTRRSSSRYNYFTAQQDQMATRISNAASQMVDEIIRRESLAQERGE